MAQDLLERMAVNRADFTLTFRRLCDAAAGTEGDAGVHTLFADPAAYDMWAAAWRQRLGEEPVSSQERAAAMRKANPVFIRCDHLVEAALSAAVERQDFQPFEELLDVVSHPYEERPGLERYATPAGPEETVRWTFCGT
jgi:serine/tyrosine/threonine adenylyltransferase